MPQEESVTEQQKKTAQLSTLTDGVVKNDVPLTPDPTEVNKDDVVDNKESPTPAPNPKAKKPVSKDDKAEKTDILGGVGQIPADMQKHLGDDYEGKISGAISRAWSNLTKGKDTETKVDNLGETKVVENKTPEVTEQTNELTKNETLTPK